MLTMPAHPDVAAGLEQLSEAEFRLMTCTNSPPDPQISPLKHAGIDVWFERSFSVDRIRRFKPAPQVYCMVAGELNVPPAVALHGGGARVGHDWSAKRRLVGSAGHEARQCFSARARVASTPGRRTGPSRGGCPNDRALALIRSGPNAARWIRHRQGTPSTGVPSRLLTKGADSG